MKLPQIINLKLGSNREIVDSIIERHAISKDINQVGLQIDCIDDAGNKFHILQFNSSRHLVTIG